MELQSGSGRWSGSVKDGVRKKKRRRKRKEKKKKSGKDKGNPFYTRETQPWWLVDEQKKSVKKKKPSATLFKRQRECVCVEGDSEKNKKINKKSVASVEFEFGGTERKIISQIRFLSFLHSLCWQPQKDTS